MDVPIRKHLELLGHNARDRVTGCKGVVDQVCFDLYGCVQVAMSRGYDKEGKRLDSHWFDASRVEIIGKGRVMEPPNYLDDTPQARGEQGSAEKPVGRA